VKTIPCLSQNGIDRFWSKVNKGSNSDCWAWSAYKNNKGYGCFGIGDKNIYLAHRVSWSISNGQIPEGMFLDHICHNTSCVNPLHLRLATLSENARNSSTPKTNRSGFKGVHFDKVNNKWRACISVNDRFLHIGRFEKAEEAASAYWEAAREWYGEFASQGLIVGLGSSYLAQRM
jgi:hypothetical protein